MSKVLHYGDKDNKICNIYKQKKYTKIPIRKNSEKLKYNNKVSEKSKTLKLEKKTTLKNDK
jgi:hypothetical protein